MISADLLRRLRNDLPMPVTIVALGRQGPPAKMSEGYFRFLCPRCGEMRATVNPRNNLAHCFCCKKNLNNIDLLITLDYDQKQMAGPPFSTPRDRVHDLFADRYEIEELACQLALEQNPRLMQRGLTLLQECAYALRPI